jgi:hypothetical protein
MANLVMSLSEPKQFCSVKAVTLLQITTDMY